MKRLIVGFESAFIFVTWLVLAVFQLVILPVHMAALLVARGCDAAVEYISDVQSIAVVKMKGD